MPLHARIDRAIAGLRERLTARHGLTLMDISVAVIPNESRVVLAGEVLVQRLRAPLVACIHAVVGPTWTVDAGAVQPAAGGAWFALKSPVSLQTGPSEPTAPNLPTPDCASVLSVEDGPVQRLASLGGAAVLVRAIDGTVGWVAMDTLREASAPSLPTPTAVPDEVVHREALRFVDTPYRLGGTDQDSIDCSGLVQRVLRSTLAVVVPRHSNDQRKLGATPGVAPSGAAHLLFVWTRDEPLCHVGMVFGDEIVHASLSRRRVVVEPRIRVEAASRRCFHVPLTEVVQFGRRVAGFQSLVAAGVVLGPD